MYHALTSLSLSLLIVLSLLHPELLFFLFPLPSLYHSSPRLTLLFPLCITPLFLFSLLLFSFLFSPLHLSSIHLAASSGEALATPFLPQGLPPYPHTLCLCLISLWMARSRESSYDHHHTHVVHDTLLCFDLKTNIGGRGWDMVCSGDEDVVVNLHRESLHETDPLYLKIIIQF